MINWKAKRWAALAIFLMAAQGGAQHTNHLSDRPQPDKSHAACPLMQPDQSKAPDSVAGHSSHLDEVNARGEQAMGFSQTATTHHFLLAPDGGIIQVEANDATDAANRESIRNHLKQIVGMFSAGNFRLPMLVHDRVPPGVATMQQRQKKLRFAYEATARGGRVRISTTDQDALAAVHEFLRFQINDHQTGDSLEVNPQ